MNAYIQCFLFEVRNKLKLTHVYTYAQIHTHTHTHTHTQTMLLISENKSDGSIITELYHLMKMFEHKHKIYVL
jgi:hypothetical protein